MASILKLGLPAGSLERATLELLAHAGWRVKPSMRSYFPSVDDPELEPVLIRPQEMPRYVAAGSLDAGICGRDWVLENDADVREIAELTYSKQTAQPVRWVLAVPEDSPVTEPGHLEGKRVATEAARIVRDYFKRKKVGARVEYVGLAVTLTVSASSSGSFRLKLVIEKSASSPSPLAPSRMARAMGVLLK